MIDLLCTIAKQVRLLYAVLPVPRKAQCFDAYG